VRQCAVSFILSIHGTTSIDERQWLDKRTIRLAYQPPTSGTFLLEQISHQQPVSNTFLSEQISISHQPPPKRTLCLCAEC
jgi:hypothetical protein